MEPTTVAAGEFKARCLHYLDEVAEHGTTFTITKRGRPVARVVPIEPSLESLEGSWSGVVEIKGDVICFDTSADWESSK